MTTLYLDLETYSEVPITHGTHAYAASAEILLFAWAIDDGAVNVWDCTTGEGIPAELAAPLGDDKVLVCAHNSQFDRTVLRHCGHHTHIHRWRDTMVQALAHSLPGSLGQLCEILRVEQDKAKDKEGKRLIQLFCKPQPANRKIRRATRETHPQEWAKFVEYAALDIEAMREIAKRLPTWNYQGAELGLWHLDQRINDRGVAVDLELAHAAIRAVEIAQAGLAKQTKELTDGAVQAATQRDALLAHLAEVYDVHLPDAQGSTVEKALEKADLPPAVRELLTIRAQASTSSTAKYRTLARATSKDGRLRGTLQFCGAARTGRWAGRLFQPQNLCRPTMPNEDIELGIEALKAGCAELIYG